MTPIFNNKPIIGMIHLLPMPGTPAYQGSIDQIIATALAEAEIYQKAGIDVLMLENMHDLPYLKNKVGAAVTTTMSIAAYEVKKRTNLPCGIQILAGANQQALAVAKAANLDFIRAEGFVFGHLADEGWIDAQAGALLRYRKQIEANDILVLCDIKKKHSAHALTADIDIAETAKAAEFFRSDGVIVTGSATGTSANLAELKAVKAAVNIPVLVGSGITLDNVADYLPHCDAMIVGSWFKKHGHWANAVEYDRVAEFMEKVREVKSGERQK